MYRVNWLTSLPTKLLLLTAVLAVSACGFHLRGQANLPYSLRILALSSDGLSYTSQKLLKQALESNGILISEDAEYRLVMLGEDEDKRTLSVTSSAKTAEYELKQSIRFILRNQEGADLLLPQTIDTFRTQIYDAEAVIGKAEEEQQMRREMQKDNISKLLRRLQAIKPEKLVPLAPVNNAPTGTQQAPAAP
jgi:LPS-assembly lipoprotein